MEIARVPISKIDEERHVAFGWASVVTENGEAVVDKQGDLIDMGSLEDAVYGYVRDSRDAGEMHERVGVGRLVESVVLTTEKLAAMGLEGQRTGWWVGYEVTDADVWKGVKDGTRSEFSIGGVGEREAVNA